MKKSELLMMYLLIVLLGISVSQSQTLELTIDNQEVVGTNYSFDIILKPTTGTVYLGGADLVLTFNAANFSNPIITVGDETTFPLLKNSSNLASPTQLGIVVTVPMLYQSNVSPKEITSNEIIINVSQVSFGDNQTNFNKNIAKLNTDNLYQFGRYTISGLINPSGTMGLAWKTSGGVFTSVSNLGNTPPFLASSLILSTPAIADIPLPVELTSFSAMSKGRNVVLNWKTATEINSSSFDVERNDGKTWMKVSDVKASGTSNAPKEYSYVDMIKSAVSGNISYRLKMIDNDGKYEYSTIAEVKIVPTVYSLEQNYPNPFNPETKIQYSLPMDAKVSLKVYDMVGREVASIVNELQSAGFYEQKFGGYNFSSGVYFYRIVAESGGKIAFTSIKKMVMIK